MKQQTYLSTHNKFKLNGSHFNSEQLCLVANSLIKEGEDFEKLAAQFILDWFDEKSYLEIQTSGTTGIPKLIKTEKQAMVNSAIATGDFFHLHPGNTTLNCLPVNYIAGKMMWVRAFVLGLEMDFVAPSSDPMKGLNKEYDFVAMVPLQVENSINKLNQINTLIIGSATVNPKLETKIRNTKCQAYETYSMTETVTHIAAKRVGEQLFTILPNVTIEQDERLCLVVSAPNLKVDKLVTNDVIELVSEHQFRWLGRQDNVINSGGVKLFSEQIEEKLADKISNRFFVSSIPDEKLGEKLILIIEGDAYKMDNTVFEDLNKYEKPKQVLFVTQFPETETGKIKRKQIIDSL